MKRVLQHKDYGNGRGENAVYGAGQDTESQSAGDPCETGILSPGEKWDASFMHSGLRHRIA